MKNGKINGIAFSLKLVFPFVSFSSLQVLISFLAGNNTRLWVNTQRFLSQALLQWDSHYSSLVTTGAS